MRRNRWIIAISCLLLAALPGIAFAEDGTAPTLAEQQALLEASIFQHPAAPVPGVERAGTGTDAGPAEIGLEAPQPGNLSCSATLDCTDGNIISCTGNSTCSKNTFEGTVTCDGNTTRCPNWCKATLQHECGGCGTYFCSCTSLVGDCSVGLETVTCNGFELPCFCPIGCCGGPPPAFEC